jgi:uncharacterized protein YciW
MAGIAPVEEDMTISERATALNLPQTQLSQGTQAYFDKCREKLGLVPNVLVAYAFDETKLRAFTDMYNDCLTAHGAALRQLSGDPKLGEQIAMNYRAANLPPRQRAMLDFAVKLTETPDKMEEADRQALRDAGFDDRAIWDIASTAAFFNMSNRMAAAIDMRPNDEYHAMAR